ncbi:MAG TPA: uracil-DNA glycosylase family protein [Chitinophagaceae bacterium]|nr:uracil-DNA glycosylase family protein [Chitinophagaceae bacterium]HNU14749.1 uracil-DNA glycosylase family protein [Chitinophagaceae bacterium]
MESLLTEIRKCTVCKDFLPNLPKPIIQASATSKIAIIGQAPGQKVQNSGIPWDDASGDNLRAWLGIEKKLFYDDKVFALVPMGFCYPGTGNSGDLAPRPECAPLWHNQVFKQMKDIKLTLLIGQYAQNYYLGQNAKETLTETVRHYTDYLPTYLPLPHPSPRNNIWQKKNGWFVDKIIPLLRERIAQITHDKMHSS